MILKSIGRVFFSIKADITGYPVAELIVGTGFFFVLSLEQIVLGFCVKKSKPKSDATKKDSDILMNGMKNSDPVIKNQVSDTSTNSAGLKSSYNKKSALFTHVS